MVITAADLKGVKPILPMLHKFNYKPVGQPILADGVVRFVGEPVAAVVAASEEEAEDIADAGRACDRADHAGGRCARRARNPARRKSTPKRPAMSSSKASVKTAGFDAVWAGAHKIVAVEARSHRQNATPMEPRGGHAAYDAATGRVTLTCTTQMPHLMRTAIADLLGMPESGLARDRARCRRRLRAENVACRRICAAGVAGAQAEKHGGLDARTGART